MTKPVRVLVPLAAFLALAMLAGFYLFAGSIRTFVPSGGVHADAIVVLTGDEDRIAAGITLISEGRGQRLLISGVHPSTRTPAELRRRVGGSARAFSCCVDLGHGAHNTIGNAVEAREWSGNWGFRSLIVVTSSYHMPRSLAEFARAMPETKLLAYPVPSRHYRLEAWWQHHPTARLLASEYLKFLSSAARLGLSRLMGSLVRLSTDKRGAPVPQAI